MFSGISPHDRPPARVHRLPRRRMRRLGASHMRKPHCRGETAPRLATDGPGQRLPVLLVALIQEIRDLGPWAPHHRLLLCLARSRSRTMQFGVNSSLRCRWHAASGTAQERVPFRSGFRTECSPATATPVVRRRCDAGCGRRRSPAPGSSRGPPPGDRPPGGG